MDVVVDVILQFQPKGSHSSKKEPFFFFGQKFSDAWSTAHTEVTFKPSRL